MVLKAVARSSYNRAQMLFYQIHWSVSPTQSKA